MPLARSFYGFAFAALVAILFAGVAVTVSKRTRTGSALAVMLVIVAAVYVAGIITTGPLVANPTYIDMTRYPFAGLRTGLTVLVDLALFFIAGIATLITAAISRHWAWLAGIVLAMLPMLVLTLGGRLPTSPSIYIQNVVPFSAALFCPLLVGLAYALSRRRPR
jgi:hypothetical protein